MSEVNPETIVTVEVDLNGGIGPCVKVNGVVLAWGGFRHGYFIEEGQSYKMPLAELRKYVGRDGYNRLIAKMQREG